MEKNAIRRGVARTGWLAAALDMLAKKGIDAVTVESLARQLGIAKSGFYWHFRDRQELLQAVLDHWMHEMTEVVTGNPEVIALEPVERLQRIAEMVIDYDLAGYDMPFRQWALSDPLAARGVRKVNQVRIDLLRQTFAELGFEGDDLEMRTMLFVGYHSMEQWMFKDISRKRRRELIRRRIALLTQPAPETRSTRHQLSMSHELALVRPRSPITPITVTLGRKRQAAPVFHTPGPRACVSVGVSQQKMIPAYGQTKPPDPREAAARSRQSGKTPAKGGKTCSQEGPEINGC